MSESLTVQISGKDDDIDVKSFLEVMGNSYKLLSHLSEQGVKWTVGSISHNSPIMFEIVASEDRAARALVILQSGFSAIRRGRDASKYFDAEALRYTQALTASLGNGVSKVAFSWRKKSFTVPRRLVLPELQEERGPYETFTELDGVIEKLDVHGGRSEFVIYDRITGLGTSCKFKDELPEMIGRYMGHRLQVFGKASFGGDNKPKSITVLRWNPVGESISLSELQGAGIRLKKGLCASEVIRSLRELDA